MSAQKGVASLEFRKGPQWPEFFDSTVVFQTDGHGEVLRFDKAAIEQLSAQRLGTKNEAKLRALLVALAWIAERSALMTNMQSALRQEWLEGLKALAAASPFSETAAEPSAGAIVPVDQARRIDFEDLRVNQLYEQGRYVHIDVTVTNLSNGARVWPEVRFKMGAQDGVANLEFRRGPDWPDFFDSSVVFRTDGHGDVLRLDTAAIEKLSADRLEPENELKLRALLVTLVAIGERSAQMANMQSASRQEWLEGLAALAKSMDGSAEK
jgi:hypothetical protein